MKCIRDFCFGFLIVILLSALPVCAAAYYVDATNGNDNNDGLSPSTAWKTIAKVNESHFLPGDFILFKRGETWREQLTIPSSGSPGCPIVFGANGSGVNPTINGADLYTTWSFEQMGASLIYYNHASLQPGQVFQNGSRLTEVETKLELSSTGKWWWDSANNRVYVRTIGDDNPNIYTIEGASQLNGVNVAESYITIQDITIKNAGANGIYCAAATGDDQSNVIIQRVTAYSCLAAGITVINDNNLDTHPMTDFTIDSCMVNDCGQYGIRIGRYVKDSTISNNTVYETSFHLESHGISTLGDNATRKPENIVIEYNKVFNTYDATGGSGQEGTGIQADDYSYNITIRYNNVYDNEGPGIRVNENANHVYIHYNVVSGNGRDGDDAGCSIMNAYHVYVYNNTFYENIRYAVKVLDWMGYVSDIVVKNNILAEDIHGELFVDSESSRHFTSDYNCFYHSAGRFYISWGGRTYDLSSYQTATLNDSNSIQSNPKFRNISSDNFALDSDSPCINAATNVGLPYDYDGTPVPLGFRVDIGAFEYKEDPNAPSPPIGLRIQ